MPSQYEKRLFRTRNKCPKPVEENLRRAMRETMIIQRIPKPLSTTKLSTILADESRRGEDESELALEFSIAGSTGNVYTVTLDYQPTCTCPNFHKRQDICKHIVYTLVKVVGLPKSSTLVYQKALLSTDLAAIHSCLAMHSGSSASGVAETRNLETSAKKARKKRCDKCQGTFKPNQGVVICPSPYCRSTFHEACLDIVPSLARLSLSSNNHMHRCKTMLVDCPLCGTEFHYDEGYENIAHETGQSRRRDHSSYRPCPGYY